MTTKKTPDTTPPPRKTRAKTTALPVVETKTRKPRTQKPKVEVVEAIAVPEPSPIQGNLILQQDADRPALITVGVVAQVDLEKLAVEGVGAIIQALTKRR